MREFLLYCAGPIKGLPYGITTDWRTYVQSKMPPHIIAVSPMRSKEYLSQETSIKDHYEEHPLRRGRGITCRDRMDVMRCDMILVNFLGATGISTGSVMEIGWADAWRKPIVVVMKDDNPHWHSMIQECAGFVVPDLDEAIKIAIAVLSPKSPNTVRDGHQ